MLFLGVALAGSLFGYGQMYNKSPKVSITDLQIDHFRRSSRERCDQAFVRFDLDADLSTLWNWNTNHIFAYIVAEYETERNKRNEVVVWDSILSEKKDTAIKARRQWNKYSLKDYGYGLKGTDVSFKFKYNIMPHMGMLMYGESGETSLVMPSEYTSKK